MDIVDRRISRINEKIRKLKYGFLLLGLILLIAGSVFTWHIWSKNSSKQVEHAVSMSRLASAALNQDELLSLTGQPSDISTDYYIQLKKALTEMKEAYPDVEIVYLYRPQEDQLVFLVDSEDVGTEIYSPPGDIYVEAHQDYWLPIQSGQITVTSEVSDRWGEWVSVLYPVFNQDNSDLIAIFGMDYQASRWLLDAKIRTALTALIVLLIFMIMSGFFLIYKRNLQIMYEKELLSQLSDQLRESERSKAALLSNLPGMAYRCRNDSDWTMLYVSDGCHDLTGYPAADLLNNRKIAFNDLISVEFRAVLRSEWDKALADEKKINYEYTITMAGGETKWVYEQGQGIYDKNGQVVALEGMIIDISELKSRENEIQYILNHDFLTGLYNRNYFNFAFRAIDTENNLPISIIIGDINGLKLINDAFGHDKGDELIRRAAQSIESCCRDQDILCRTGGDEFSLLLPRTSAAGAHELVHIIRDRLEQNMRGSDKMFAVNLSVGYGTKSDKNKDFSLAVKEAENHMNKRKLLEGKSSHSTIISSIKATMFARSQETEAHADRMANNSRLIGKRLGLSESQLNELELLATLHDIGKIGIDDSVMNKPEPLSPEEWTQMKKHPEIGYRIAMASPELAPIAEYILSHHERWDGTGYPQGQKGEEIPLLSRVLAIVDAYDAITENRVYSKAKTKEEAIAEIARCAGSQFDPQIAKLFIELFPV